jgi:hypothetical protein
MKFNWTKYLLALLITALIFATAFYIASSIDARRIADIRLTEQNISIDLLSTETQFELLGSLNCQEISENPILTGQLNSLAERLSYAENTLGATNPEVVQLKKQYSLLEIKDYILSQQINEKCKTKSITVLYFYSNEGDCADCTHSGEVLTYLRQKYPALRVYSFDYNLDLSALRTLLSLNKLEGHLPAFIINGREPVYGFRNLDDMQALIPELATLSATTTSATKAQATSTKTK